MAKIGGAYAAVARFCATMNGKFTFAHEVGHLFWARHDAISQMNFCERTTRLVLLRVRVTTHNDGVCLGPNRGIFRGIVAP